MVSCSQQPTDNRPLEIDNVRNRSQSQQITFIGRITMKVVCHKRAVYFEWSVMNGSIMSRSVLKRNRLLYVLLRSPNERVELG